MPELSERDSGERYLRPGQVQRHLGIAASTLFGYVRRHVITPSHYTAGGHARFAESEVIRLKAELSQLKAGPMKVAA